LGERLGEGEYGEVRAGVLRRGPGSGPPVPVAVKTLRVEGEAAEWTRREFLQEATVMMALEHPHIVRILGVSWNPRILMVNTRFC
jgi:serine/threonine protein kinase